MTKFCKQGILLVVALLMAVFFAPLSYAGNPSDEAVLGNDRWSVDSGGNLTPLANNSYNIGNATYIAKAIYAGSITLGGSAITSWGSVVSPWTDDGQRVYLTSSGTGPMFITLSNGNIVSNGTFTAADNSGFATANGAVISNATDNAITIT